MVDISRADYAALYGPTTGDQVRLGDTDLWIEIEADHTFGGEEAVFGGGKSIRESMAQSTRTRAQGALDTVITNAIVLDHWGIVRADVGIRDGRIVALGRGAPIRHFVSSSRDVDQMWFYGCRNDILTVWRHVPMPYLPGRLAMTVAHLVWLGVGVRRPVLFLRGTRSGLRHALSASRRPMPRRLYRLYRRLERRGAIPLNEIVDSLPAPPDSRGGR